MSTVVKSATGVSLATVLPDSGSMIGPIGDVATPAYRTGGAGQKLDSGDLCYVNSSGEVMPALEDQTGTTAAVNDVQTMGASQNTSNVSAGGYVLGYKGVYTALLAYNASAGTVQTAIQALSTVGAGNILVTSTFPNFVFTAASGLAGTPLDLIEVQPSLVDLTSQYPVTLSMVHTTMGLPIGASGAEQAQSRVFGMTMKKYNRGEPVTLYHGVIMMYSDGNLTPGADYYLSGTVPGALDTARTLAVGVQFPVARAIDSQRLWVFHVR